MTETAQPKTDSAGRAKLWHFVRPVLLRILYGVVSLLFISFITFIADEIAPGDAATIRAGDKATAAQVTRLREEMGLNRPWPVRYVEFLGNASRLEFGNSTQGTQQPIRDTLAKSLPVTMSIASVSILIAAIFGILFGMVAAIRENKVADRAILSFSTLGVTIPNYVLLPILVLLFSPLFLDLLPTSYEPPDRQVAPGILYILIPVLVLSLRPMATLTRLMRASMIETLKQEFVRLAVAKGVSPRRLYWTHCFRNALIPVLTAIGTSFGYLLTGSFVVESAYLVPGIGKTAIEAITQRDTPMILASTFVTGFLFIVVNLVVDILIPLIDPRVRESQV